MKIAVSACLLGERCRFDGASKPCAEVMALAGAHDLVPVCPELAGGMPIPHDPCELVGRGAARRVIDSSGADRTEEFERGARETLHTALDAGCVAAVLKAKSPSCGSGTIYDGTFTRTLVPGFGVAAALLRDAGVRIVDESHVQDLFAGTHSAQ